ncbi:MAG: lysylphosphatidylglycerol synthase domain-containing protein [Gemmatimonadota bacterium]
MTEPARRERAGGRRGWSALAQVALVAFLGWWIWRALAPQFAELGAADLTRWRPDPLLLAASLLLLVAVYLAHAFLWRRILTDLALGRPAARTTLRVYFLAGLGRYVPGKLWQFAGLAILSGRAGLPPGGAAAAQVLGQLAFLSTGLLLLALLLPNLWAGPWALLAALALVGAAVGGWLVATTAPGHAARAWLAARAGQRRGAKVHGAFELADRVRAGRALLWAAGYGASWLLLGAAFTLFVAAFVPGAEVLWRSLTGTVAGAYLFGYAMVLAPAGIGARELSMVALLEAAFAGWGGSPPGVLGAVLVVTVASRLWFTAAELLPLLLLPVLPDRDGADAATRGSGSP